MNVGQDPYTVKKIATGIAGFDEMARGGLPRGRTSVVLGASGTGKTVFAMQALLHQMELTGGTGMFVSFEQSVETVLADMHGFGWGVGELVQASRLFVVDGRPRPEAIQAGRFDMDHLLAVVENAAEQDGLVGVVFDGLDALLMLLDSHIDQRCELLRLQESVYKLQITAILTVKQIADERYGFSDIIVFLSDCVIELQRSTDGAISSRNLRITKYRSSAHLQNWVPYVITSRGIQVKLIDANTDGIVVSNDRVPTGIDQLDKMLDGGVFRGSTTLLTGSPGTSKTTLGTRFVAAACQRGERALCVCFDESPAEIIRNVSSVGTHLAPHVDSGLLRMQGMVARWMSADECALEVNAAIREHEPSVLMIDPVSAFTGVYASQNAIRRVLQHCKHRGITVILTSLLDRRAGEVEASQSQISTLADNWIHLSFQVDSGERNRALTIVKARGTAHSRQVGELLLSNAGISIAQVYTESGAVLMGSLRWQRERENQLAAEQAKLHAALEYRQASRAVEELASNIEALTAELNSRRDELRRLSERAEQIELNERERRSELSQLRSGQPDGAAEGTGA